MVNQAHPRVSRVPAGRGRSFRLIASRRGRSQLDLFTYIVGTALFWTLLARSVDLHRPLVLVGSRAVGWLDARTRAPRLAHLREGEGDEYTDSRNQSACWRQRH
jgi:hypothetical protein